MRKVFISHSWEDNDISRKLAEYLKRDGADIWIDYTRIHGGDSLPRRISEALEWCDTLILLWSKAAKESYYVNLEWENALDMRKVIIPCPLDETNRPAILRRCRFIDFKNFDSGYRQLADALDLAIQKEVIKKVVQPVIEKPKREIKSPIVPPESQRKVKAKTLFRDESTTLSYDDVKAMLKKMNFFDSSWNKEGSGFANQYKAETIKGDKVVFDEASGLMWQQSGSSEYMRFEEAKKWIADLNKIGFANSYRTNTIKSDEMVFDKILSTMWQQGNPSDFMKFITAKERTAVLNNKGFAGFHNWRLPTIEEAMSLMEPEKMNKGLYIDPIFDRTQKYIWTSDLFLIASTAWIVVFKDGDCYHDLFSSNYYVRAVRFGQSDKSD